ncbi:MAG: hypothetical protein ACI81V_001490 [Lentimonas sp.]|jgi:hypothetical protein
MFISFLQGYTIRMNTKLHEVRSMRQVEYKSDRAVRIVAANRHNSDFVALEVKPIDKPG